MKVCIDATCIVVGLGALFHSSAAYNVRQVVGILNGLSLCFDVEGIHGSTFDAFEALKLTCVNAGRMHDTFVKSPQQNGFDYSAVKDDFPKREDFMALFDILFTDTAIQVYECKYIFHTMTFWSSDQIQKFLNLLLLLMGGNDYLVTVDEYKKFVAYCTGVVDLTEDSRANVELIYNAVLTQNNSVIWDIRSIKLNKRFLYSVGDFLTGSKTFLDQEIVGVA